jgi:peptidoglycan/LPS O-acetylase OafA/YrhL
MAEREQDEPAGRKHLPALDGLRGVAILMVMLFHYFQFDSSSSPPLRFTYKLFQSGWAGVNLFFVLSGFLITGILLDSKGSPRYFRNFYIRRVLRIFPLYYASLFLLFVLLPHIHWSICERYRAAVPYQWWYWGYSHNLLVALHNGGPPAADHFWSLAVEEQFYLLWPLLVLLCNRQGLMITCMAAIISAPLWRLGIYHYFAWDSWRLKVLTISQVDSIACGALVACLLKSKIRPAILVRAMTRVGILSGFAIAMMYLYVHSFSEKSPIFYTIGLTVFALFFSSILTIAVCGTSTGIFMRCLESRALRFFGKYSYGLYVCHVPIMVAALDLHFTSISISGYPHNPLIGKWCWALLMLGSSVVCALLSWNLLENRFLKLKSKLAP